MKLGNTIPEAGSIIEWDLDEITSRLSGDLPIYVNEVSRRSGRTGHVSYSSTGVDPELIKEGWDACMRRKRNDFNYEDILNSIRDNGFVRPINAFVAGDELRICDGHHRIAAALELGLTAVPVKVHYELVTSQDSGSWYAGVPVANPDEDDDSSW